MLGKVAVFSEQVFVGFEPPGGLLAPSWKGEATLFAVTVPLPYSKLNWTKSFEGEFAVLKQIE